ncbi:MAG: DUF4365 domain-containing protein [Devosia sp.]|nr:DUF4365 domain-containing protein [Devosia sp.]
MKTVTDNQLNGELGETLVKAAIQGLGHVFEGRGRLETGIDGTIEFRDPSTRRMLGKTVAVQVKTTANGAYVRESDAAFEYVLRTADLDYWHSTNLPVVIVLLRLSDRSLYWKDVTAGVSGDERRLTFDKVADRLDAASLDRMAQLSVDRGRLGSYVPPMRSGEPAHLNLMHVVMPDEIFVADSPFKSGRDAIPTLLRAEGPQFDWVIRGRRFVSFRDPRGTALETIVAPDTVEAVETSCVAATDDPDDELVMIELLRRTMDEQFSVDLAFDKEARAFHFRPPDPLAPREYKYRSLKEMTSATVVQLYPDRKKPDRLNNVRHHAFVPRFERIGDDWFLSITPTFFFTENGSRPHRFASTLLAGKKRLDRNGSIRGQILLWRHLLANNDAGADESRSLFNLDPQSHGPGQVLQFVPLEPLMMEAAVPEDAWVTSDPNAKRMKAEPEPPPSLLWESRA